MVMLLEEWDLNCRKSGWDISPKKLPCVDKFWLAFADGFAQKWLEGA
jgi:hypothetical protein